MPTNHQTEAAGYGGESCEPFEFDETVEPDLADGTYDLEVTAKPRMSNPDKATGRQYPQILLEWKALDTDEDSEECRRSVGNTTSEFLTLKPKGDKSGNFSKRRMTLLRNRWGIDPISGAISVAADLQPICDAFTGQQTKGTVVNKADKTGTMRTNINLVSEGGSAVEEEEVEVAPAAKPATKKPATKAAAKPAAKASKRN